ncbi:MAG TPA: hypothetical protein DCW90_09725 [Lachnospiraceae bacterium]|nr:hypothetical protein [Lachnospiraceae bacterium]
MKINLNHLDEWDDYMDDDEVVIKKFPRENKNVKNFKKENVRKARKEKMSVRAQEEKSSYEGIG